VVLAARRIDRLEELAARIERAGGTAVALACDVSDRKELARLPVIVEELLGPADIVVNNAGVPGGGNFADLTHEQIQNVVDVNLMGVLHATRAFLPPMLARGHGHIVNVASLAGLFATPGSAVYSATKHAVVAFSEALNYDTAPRNVLVTSVNPGFVHTEGFPAERVPRAVRLEVDQVADAIVKVVKKDIAPSYSIPRWLSPFQLFRILTPPLYRWGVRIARSIKPSTAAAP
jgi:short-subunit dehydrogenase